MGLEDQEAVSAAVGALEEVGKSLEVPDRLRHLLAADLDEAVVDPTASEAMTSTQRLRPLVLVVGEGEVLAAAVQVEVVAKERERHDRALDVPARPPVAPRRIVRRR